MIDRKLYEGWFFKNEMNSWRCPRCNSGTLNLENDKFLMEENATTKQFFHHEDFNIPYDLEFTYTAMLICTNPKCQEVVVSTGKGGMGVINETITPEGYIDTQYDNIFKPVFFHPPLHIFRIPEDTPENIKQAIISSFSLAFNNHSAAANQIRIALECLLTHLKVKRFETIRGKRKRLNLHQRIELLPVKHKNIKEVCLAIKWLGNAGSHCDDKMSFDDVFDGYDMLSFVLEELYDNKHEHVKKLAKRINEKKGV
jgi:hypothetical protein